eukprot:g25453.t1
MVLVCASSTPPSSGISRSLPAKHGTDLPVPDMLGQMSGTVQASSGLTVFVQVNIVLLKIQQVPDICQETSIAGTQAIFKRQLCIQTNIGSPVLPLTSNVMAQQQQTNNKNKVARKAQQ